jgi:CheY-like chemotaxis protein
LARKILLADDSVTAQNMGRKILADAGYEVITVNNGSAALKKIAEVKPDLIVLDVYMPGYSGLEVCQRLKEAGETARIPVLLTVGKLEPFKPEEARRVRAEGFIVKPFEASELLSALTKLEDKMVPRSESSKPGRFARTIAAVEEGRYDKTMAPDEDSGWKSRIAFPSKKKKAAEEESDDSTIYNQVNKDLRTVVEHKPTAGPQEKAPDAKAEESRVDLTAVAPEGLPKDVTAEEIAALAAAAAQMQGKMAEAKGADAKIEPAIEAATTEPAKIEVSKTYESRTDESKTGDTKAAESKAAEPVAEPAVAAQAASHESQKVQAEEKPDPQHSPEATATFAEQKVEEKTAEAAKDGGPAPTASEVTATIAALDAPGISTSWASTSSQQGSLESLRQPEPEPVTMAAGAAAPSAGTSGPRWTAVAVAVAPEESGIVLEDEMRRAYAAYAAYAGAEVRPAQAAPISEPPASPEAVISELPSAVFTAAASAEAAQPVPSVASGEAELVQSSAAMSSSPEGTGARVKSFETVAASQVESQPAISAERVQDQQFESVLPAESRSAEAEKIEARTEEAPIAEVPEPAVTEAIPVASSPEQKDTERVEANEEIHHEEPAPSAAASTAVESAEISAQARPTFEATPVSEHSTDRITDDRSTREPFTDDRSAGDRSNEGRSTDGRSSELSAATESALTESSPVHEPPRGAKHDAPSKESDIAATTAAAWASWRRIRETGDPKDSSHKGDDQADRSRDEAAMAVAAGAEKAPEEGPEIASIVDSVLADLRPKIVEEISRKLKKK